MRNSTVISVDPGKIAEGARFPDLILEGINQSAGNNGIRHSLTQDPILNFFLPTRKSGVGYSFFALSVRFLLASVFFLALSGSHLYEGLPALSGIVLATAGIMAALGFMSRPLAITSAIYFILTAFESSDAGFIDIPVAIASGIATLSAAAGPGRISLDGVIRTMLIRFRRNGRPSTPRYNEFSSRF